MSEMIMLINVSHREETRLALIENGRLEEFHIERSSHETIVGNIYKAIVENCHSGLQAAFVKIGLDRNAFMHAHEAFYADLKLDGRAPRPARQRGSIWRLLRPGQEIYVQVLRDGFGEKGPTITTEIGIPGKYLILTPTSNEIVVAKKVVHVGMRNRLRRIVADILRESGQDLPGFMIKAGAAGAEPKDLKADFEYILKLWNIIKTRAKESPAPALLYKEPGLAIRWVRDFFKKSIQEIVIDGHAVYQRLADYLASVMPGYRERLKLYEGPAAIFDHFGVQAQIDELSRPIIDLPSGGRLYIQPTEALIAVDVDSGKVRESDPEKMAVRTNEDAAREVMRQLRLRDLSGVIVIDFVDMREPKNIAAIQQILEDEARKDRAQMTILPMNPFCITELARQKMRPGIQIISHQTCPACGGTGVIKSAETMGLDLLRALEGHLERPDVSVIEVRVHPDVAKFLQDRLGELDRVEARYGKKMYLFPVPELGVNQSEVVCYDHRGEKVVAPVG